MPRYPFLAGLLCCFVATAAQANDGSYCREFTKKIRVGGQLQNAYGTACYQPNGSWQIVQEPRVAQPNVRNVRGEDYPHIHSALPWQTQHTRPLVLVNDWEDRWSPDWNRGHSRWHQSCPRRPHYGYRYGHDYRHHRYGDRVNISYSF